MTIRQFFARDMKLRHLRLLIAIDDAGQLSKVARLMHVTQPALSKALAEIEHSIGAPLFERTAHGLVPNRAGAALIRAARSALAELERASGDMENLARGLVRSLSIGAMPTSALALVAPAVALLGRRAPDVAVSVVEAPTNVLLPELVAGRIDLLVGARLRRAQPDGIEGFPLYDEPMQIVVAPRHPLVRRTRVGWDACIAHPWVLPPPSNPIRVSFERALRRAGLPSPARVTDALMTDLVIGLLAEADAVNLMPDRQARALQKRGLVRIVAEAHARTLDIWMPVTAFAQAERAATAGVAAMLDCLREVASSPAGAG
ncbi:MAG: LysR family transcriptional regulator [Burkholderiales bacterium]|nr:LysR family transcriptional regulator [Burkholderiales bacterium]